MKAKSSSHSSFSREWSEKEIRDLIKEDAEVIARDVSRREAGRLIADRRRFLHADAGIMTLEGKLEIRENGPYKTAHVNFSDVSQFLASHWNNGQEIRILVLSGKALKDDDASKEAYNPSG